MKLDKKGLERLVREQLTRTIAEYSVPPGQVGMTVHPFNNHLANQPDTGRQENIYDGIADAALGKMITAYEDEKEIKKIIRVIADKESSGSGGVGGRFTDAQIEEVLVRLYEKVLQKLGVDLASFQPQDREHPHYRELE